MKKSVPAVLLRYPCFFIICILFMLPASTAFSAKKTIGVILTGDIPYYREIHKNFLKTLSARGLGDDKVSIIVQKPSPVPMSWVNAARKLVTFNADVIVSYGTPATLAVMNETSKVPVVFAGVYDPQAFGLEGKNATGISSRVPIESLLKNLMSISRFSHLGVLFSLPEKDTILQAKEVKELEGKMGFTSVRFNIKNPRDIDKIKNIDALLLTTSCAAMHCLDNIIDITRKARIPTATTLGGGEESGIILTLSADPGEQGRVAAELAAKVIQGTNLSSLPVERPVKIDMIINLKEATDIGIKIPFDLLSSATKVIR